MKQTDLSRKLGSELAIIQAPMAGGATTPELVAAVSNSGGLGSLGAGYLSPQKIREAINAIRKLTKKSFAVNLFIPEKSHATLREQQEACQSINESCKELDCIVKPVQEANTPSFEDQLMVVLEERVPVFSFTFGVLTDHWIAELHKNGTCILGTATTLAEARLLEAKGVDVIVAQSCEAGGHRGNFLATTEDSLIGLISLIPQLRTYVTIPIVAAGGIMDGRGMVAATTLGADGVQMGTAFLTCHESGISEISKQTLLAQQQDNTILTRAFSGKFVRSIRNKFTDRMENKKATILPYPIQNALTMQMRKKATQLANMDFMAIYAGQSAYLCRSMSAKELINSLVKEATAL